MNQSSKICSKIKAALIQCKVVKDKERNLDNASKLINIAKQNRAELIALPEYFNTPSTPELFDEYSESVPNGPSCEMLAEQARKHKIYLVGGTMPEKVDSKIYNTCTVWNPDGQLIAKYRKIHLFDVNIPGGIALKESEFVSPGNELATFQIKNIKVGLGICYDIRFEEQARLYKTLGCKLLLYTGAFNMTTGPLHWQVIQRGRAIDNQLYVCGVSTARGDKGYISWGYSQITDPWGNVIATAGHGEEITYGDIDTSECDKVRENIPISKQRRL